jgi:proteasome lid subunit RPN8/RPN11
LPRVDVDSKRDPIQIAAPILQEMMSHAVQSDPEECCGLIVGDEGVRYLRVHRFENEMTKWGQAEPRAFPRDNRSGFYMNPHQVERVRRQASETGQRVTAVYHSHVGADAYLSDMDLEHAEHALFPFPDADWIVLAVYERQVRRVALFRPGAEGFEGHPVPIEVATP